MRTTLLFLCLAAVCGNACAADYAIQLHRPGKAGQTYRISATGGETKLATIRSGGKVVKSDREEYSLEFEGTATILETGLAGHVVKVAVQVDKAVRIAGGRRSELLSRGAVVTELRRGSSQAFEVDGRAPAPELKDALSTVLAETQDPDEGDDDSLIGTQARKKTGERWGVNAERLAAFFSKSPGSSFTLTARDLKGSVGLTRLVKVGAIDCLQIDGSVAIALPPQALQAGSFATERASMQYVFSGLFPVDASLGRLQESARLTIRFLGRSKATADRPEATLEGTMEKSTLRRLTSPR